MILLDAAVLTTARLTLRPLALADAVDLFAIRHDAGTMRHSDALPDASLDQCIATTRGHVAAMADGDVLHWVARVTEDGQFAGQFALKGLKSDTATLSFLVPVAMRRQGLGSEACGALIAHARNEGHRTLAARIHDADRASAVLLGQFGFTETEARRPVEIRPGTSLPCRFYALTLNRRMERNTIFAW